MCRCCLLFVFISFFSLLRYGFLFGNWKKIHNFEAFAFRQITYIFSFIRNFIEVAFFSIILFQQRKINCFVDASSICLSCLVTYVCVCMSMLLLRSSDSIVNLISIIIYILRQFCFHRFNPFPLQFDVCLSIHILLLRSNFFPLFRNLSKI